MTGALNLTGQDMVQTYQNLVTTGTSSSGSILCDATGSRLITVVITSSYAQTASYAFNQITPEFSSSWASASFSSSFALASISSSFSPAAISSSFALASISSSFATSSSFANTASYFSPSAGVVSNLQNATGSSGSAGFASVAEFSAFVLAVSQSFITLNLLLADLRSKGLIS